MINDELSIMNFDVEWTMDDVQYLILSEIKPKKISF